MDKFEPQRARVLVLRSDNFLVIQAGDDIYFRARSGPLKDVVAGTEGIMTRSPGLTGGTWTFTPDPPAEG